MGKKSLTQNDIFFFYFLEEVLSQMTVYSLFKFHGELATDSRATLSSVRDKFFKHSGGKTDCLKIFFARPKGVSSKITFFFNFHRTLACLKIFSARHKKKSRFVLPFFILSFQGEKVQNGMFKNISFVTEKKSHLKRPFIYLFF